MLDRIKQMVKGLRTILFSAAVALLGIMQAFGMVDITPMLRLFVKDEEMIPVILCFLAVSYTLLRLVTNTGVGQSTAPPNVPDVPLKGGLDEGE